MNWKTIKAGDKIDVDLHDGRSTQTVTVWDRSATPAGFFVQTERGDMYEIVGHTSGGRAMPAQVVRTPSQIAADTRDRNAFYELRRQGLVNGSAKF